LSNTLKQADDKSRELGFSADEIKQTSSAHIRQLRAAIDHHI